MIYLFFGDQDRARTAARELFQSLAEKKPDAGRYVFDALTWSEALFDELISAQGLFTPKSLIYCNKISENTLALEFIRRFAPALQKSPNIFLLVEGSDPTLTSLIISHAEKTREFKKVSEKAPAYEGGGRAAFFRVTDACGNRDWQAMWTGIQKLYREGHAPEAIHAVLFWFLKTMLLAKDFEGDIEEGAREAGVKVYPFRKALGFSKRFEKNELEDISSALVSMYHDAHWGGLDFDLALGKIILEFARRGKGAR